MLLVERRAAEPILPHRLLTQRDFVLATIGGLCFALAMTGVVGYIPTYLQMAEGLNATTAGLMMIPMVAGIMTSSFGGGSLISRTGRYKWMPIAGAAVVAACLLALSSVTVTSPLWEIGVILYGMGVGMGLGGQSLVLTAQNAFPREVGTSTAAFAFFKEIGASLGASVIGGLFGARLATGWQRRPTSGWTRTRSHRVTCGGDRGRAGAGRGRLSRLPHPRVPRAGPDDARGGCAAALRPRAAPAAGTRAGAPRGARWLETAEEAVSRWTTTTARS